MYNCMVLYNAPWIEALSLRTVAKRKAIQRRAQTNDKHYRREGGRKGERERESG